jgi:hypothetical protein
MRSNKTGGIPFYKLKDKNNNYGQIYLQNQNIYFYNSSANKGFYFNKSVHFGDTLFLKDGSPLITMPTGISYWQLVRPGSLYLYSVKNIMINKFYSNDSIIIGNLDNTEHNINLGIYSGNNTITGLYNINIGHTAGFSLTTGSSNVSIGRLCGRSHKKGDYNTFLGPYAAYEDTSGSYNIMIGYKAGYYLTNSSHRIILTTMGWGNVNQDTANALFSGLENSSPINSRLTINGNLIAKYSLTVAGDTVATKPGLINFYKQTKTRVGSDSIYFDRPVTVYTTDTITASITLIPRRINAVAGYTAIQRVIGDGTHTITFSGVNGSDIFDPTLNQVSLICWLYDGYEWWYSIKVK